MYKNVNAVIKILQFEIKEQEKAISTPYLRARNGFSLLPEGYILTD